MRGLVDGEPAGRVDDDGVAHEALGVRDPTVDDVDDRGARRCPVHRDIDRPAERLELVCGGGPIRVCGDEERPATDADDVPRELGGRRGLARPLEADENDDRGAAREMEDPVARAEERGELLVDDRDDLLTGGEALEDLGAEGALADAGDEVLDDLEVDVRLEEREADLAHRGIDVRLGDAAAPREGRQRTAEAVAQGVEHGTGVDSWLGGRRRMRRSCGARVLTRRGSRSVADGLTGRRGGTLRGRRRGPAGHRIRAALEHP
jgi:hypothetical protein